VNQQEVEGSNEKHSRVTVALKRYLGVRGSEWGKRWNTNTG
jgi:hypothetical protein